MVVGVRDRGRPLAVVTDVPAPDLPPRGELDADRQAHAMALTRVNVTADQDHATVMILKRATVQEVLLGRSHRVACFGEFHQSAARLVAGSRENIVALNQGGRDVRGVVRHLVVVPKELPVVRAYAHDAATRELHVLFDARAVRNHDRGVAGAVASRRAHGAGLRPPDLFARRFVEADHEC